MAIPYQVQLHQMARLALRMAGQLAPSDGMIEEVKADIFQLVKNDIKFYAPEHPLLETDEIVVTTRAVRTVGQPSKAHLTKSVLLLVGPDAWQGTAQAGASTTITLAAAFSEDEGTVKGNMIVTLGGTGSLQYRHITAYNNTTKVATVSPAWTTNPSSDTTYLIVQKQVELFTKTSQVLNYEAWITGEGEPLFGAMKGETLWLNQSPDKIYPLLWTYYTDLDQLDEAGSLALKILREWNTVINRGLTSKCQNLYDDTRADTTTAIYDGMLRQLQGEALTSIEQTQPYDPVVPYV